MGKYLKTEIDWQMINEFAKEILRMDFDNPVLKNGVTLKDMKVQSYANT